MPSGNVTLGIDLGTQSTKVIIYDADEQKILALAQAPHDIIQRPDGTSEQLASWWIDALDSCLSEIAPELKKAVKAIGVSGQQHGFVPVDEKGGVLYNVKLWNDTSTAAECEEITRAFGGRDKLLAEVGNPIVPGYTAPKIIWLKNHEPDKYRALATVLLPHDYMNFYLTGKRTMEHGDASGTGFLNIKSRAWQEDLLKAADPEKDLRACLPGFIRANQPAGVVTPEIAKKYGFSEGVLVSAGGGDNMMAAIGTGCVADGIFTASLGTSGTLYGYSDQPIVDADGIIAAFSSSSGGWLPLICTMNCTVATELTRKLLDTEVKEIEGLAATVPAGSDGLVTVPFYNGERTPNLPNATGTLLGITPHNLTKPHLLRSAMESALFGLRYGLDAFRKRGLAPKSIHLTGGGSKSGLWRQMAANIFGCPIACPEMEETAAFGAAIQALWMLESKSNDTASIETIAKTHVRTTGATVKPEPAAVSTYNEVYATYSEDLDLLTPHFTKNS